MKKFKKSGSKNKHPIKLRFLIWRLQGANREKKVIPENQGFGSCPYYLMAVVAFVTLVPFDTYFLAPSNYCQMAFMAFVTFVMSFLA